MLFLGERLGMAALVPPDLVRIRAAPQGRVSMVLAALCRTVGSVLTRRRHLDGGADGLAEPSRRSADHDRRRSSSVRFPASSRRTQRQSQRLPMSPASACPFGRWARVVAAACRRHAFDRHACHSRCRRCCTARGAGPTEIAALGWCGRRSPSCLDLASGAAERGVAPSAAMRQLRSRCVSFATSRRFFSCWGSPSAQVRCRLMRPCRRPCRARSKEPGERSRPASPSATTR
jgi:hypothetical protein